MRFLVVAYENGGARTHVLAPGQRAVLGGASIENTPAGLWVNGKPAVAGSVTQLNAGETISVFESLNPLPRPISLAGQSVISIGRSGKNDVCLSGGQVSGNHARLRKGSNGWTLSDLGSRNGVYVNGEKAQSALLREDDTLFLGGFLLRLHGGALHFESVCAGVSSTLKELSSLPMEPAPLAVEYPWFQRGPRNRPELKTEEIEILAPPQAGSKPNVSWLSVLLPPILMISVMVVVAVVMSGNGGMSLMSLAFTVPMSIISVIVSIVNYRSQTKKWAENQLLARNKYDAHLAGQERKIQQAESAYAEGLRANYPSADNCLRIARTRDRRLWERVPADEDFLSVRAGTADAPSNVTVKTPRQQLSLEENPLLEQAQRLKEKHTKLKALPVTLNLREAYIAGLAGSNENIYALLCGLAALHSYEDVKLCCVFPRSQSRQWDWLRWLPHCWDNERRERFLACTPDDAKRLLLRLDEILKLRGREKKAHTPHYVVVLCDQALAEQSGVTLSPGGPEQGMTVLYSYQPLPGACRAVIDGKGCVPDKVTLKQAEEFARGLAPVRIKSSSGAAKMPEMIPFLQGLGVRKTEELNVLGRWAQSRPFESLAAPIGLRENGEVFRFDIHERGYGPHGIVAGTAGWGKSEALTTWILSLALHFQPWELSFVLIDFKGDGLSGALLELPHVAGVISNIHDISSIERNLASLEGELLRRQRVFAETKMENIHQYQEACRAGRVSEPVPYLIIVIDEFAELKTRHPEQMDKFISVARIGRSLGVYMVLATQSPGGGIVTGQVSANTRFRICLKTADAGESKDILGASDAFDLNVRGRAIVKVGNNEVYEKIQTFFSKAPYRPDEGTGVKIEVVELDGTRERPEAYEKTAPAQGTDFSQARAVANYIIETARRAGAPKARQVLLPPLPETLYLSGLLNGYAAAPGGLALPAGLVDDPEGQRQYPFVLDFARQGHHLFYGAPGTGKTNLLRTALVATARLYPPELAQFAVLDFGAWGLKLFERLSRCRCYASEQDGVAEAESFLKSEIDRRKRAFAEQGVGRLEDYREITGEAMPWILVTIDNLAALHNAHPDFLDTLLVAARDGAALGIGLLMTTGGGGAFLYRMQNYIQNIHCLRLTDKSEYRQHVGGGGRREPGDFPGRGFTKGPLEFQAALFMDGATEAERIKNLRVLCESQQPAAPSRERAPLTRCEEYIQLGYDEKGGPVAFYFNDMSGCVFVNNGLLEAVTRALPGRVVSDDFDAQIGEIAAEYNRRGEGERSGPPMYICIKDYPAFFEAADNETVARLDLLVRYGENCGIYVYIAGKAEQLSRFAQLKEPLFHSCLLSGNAVVAGHCDFIETPILGKNEVYLLHDGVKTRMEVPHA